MGTEGYGVGSNSIRGYQLEQAALVEDIRRSLLTRHCITAAWLSVERLHSEIHVVVSDEDYYVMEASVQARVQLVENPRRVLLFDVSDASDEHGCILDSTEMFVLYAGEIAPHPIQYFWHRLTRAHIPAKYCEVLFERVDLPRTNSQWTIDQAVVPKATSIDESIARRCSAYWRFILAQVCNGAKSISLYGRSVIESKKALEYDLELINELERYANLAETPMEEVFGGAANHTTFGAARTMVDHGERITGVLRASSVHVPEPDTPEQVRKLIDVIELEILE